MSDGQQKAVWGGYEFRVYDVALSGWNDVGGVYIFAGVDAANRWYAHYIGQTGSFKTRIPGHERLAEATSAYRTTHIHARTVPDSLQRTTIEQALVRSYQPPMNRQAR